jgi:hypothetical protein
VNSRGVAGFTAGLTASIHKNKILFITLLQYQNKNKSIAVSGP